MPQGKVVLLGLNQTGRLLVPFLLDSCKGAPE